jgi:hypothetical protein
MRWRSKWNFEICSALCLRSKERLALFDRRRNRNWRQTELLPLLLTSRFSFILELWQLLTITGLAPELISFHGGHTVLKPWPRHFKITVSGHKTHVMFFQERQHVMRLWVESSYIRLALLTKDPMRGLVVIVVYLTISARNKMLMRLADN